MLITFDGFGIFGIIFLHIEKADFLCMCVLFIKLWLLLTKAVPYLLHYQSYLELSDFKTFSNRV